MAQTPQYKTTAQRARIQTYSAGIHHPIAGKANHELTFKPDQSVGADQNDQVRLPANVAKLPELLEG